ncbi:kinase-like domain-containing protein [Fennellomyces sp. T-0311]|nr:kinase-like domain-containing protein [Fennellomyces sp. T-0311]
MSAFPGPSRFTSSRRKEINEHTRNPINERMRNPASENKMGDLEVIIPKDLQRHAAAMQPRQPLAANRQSVTNVRSHHNPFPTTHKYRRGLHASRVVPNEILDKDTGEIYKKICFLGEGGFARCYKVQNSRGSVYAAKVISKSTLLDEKNKQKLFAEISIHRSMNHRGIVRFHHCFEDARNVYLILELCENKTLVEMLKSRSRLTEPEVRFFLIQVLDACRYMHDNRVIHRDIKMSNTFLDKNMNVKMGDFGLAALLVGRNDRKKTICGTPNYIAPEILFEKSGHDHKVDMWSIGVLMFTLLVGKHPFQQSDVKHIYKKIKENQVKASYQLPAYLSEDAKDLIPRLLVNKPSLRLSVPEVLSHSFFQKGLLPSRIPSLALNRIPTDEELYSSSRPSNIMESPGRAGEALRDAIDANKSYVDRRPVGELKLMSEVIPDPRSQFPGRPVHKGSEPSKDADASKRRTTLAEEQPRKRRDVDPAQAEFKVPSPVARKNRDPPKVSVLETMARVLKESLEEAKKADPGPCQTITDMVWTPSSVFLDKWVDFTAKYGLCYSLTDDTHGVFFTDATTLLSKDDGTYQYVVHDTSPVTKHTYSTNEIPAELKKKVYLMTRFKEHMNSKLARMADNMPVVTDSEGTWTFLSKYIVSEHALVFRLSNGVVQVSSERALER